MIFTSFFFFYLIEMWVKYQKDSFDYYEYLAKGENSRVSEEGWIYYIA